MYVKGQGAKSRSVLLCLEYFFYENISYFIFILLFLICQSQGRCQGEAGELAVVEISAMVHSGVQQQYVPHCASDALCTYEQGSKGFTRQEQKTLLLALGAEQVG